VVSNLGSLVEHVQKSLRLIEQTIAGETSRKFHNIIVLDDVRCSSTANWPAGGDRALPASGGGSCRRARASLAPVEPAAAFPMESEQGPGFLI
jgi:hypothetical protein